MGKDLRKWMEEQLLVRITIVKRKMGSSIILGRILEIDTEHQNLLVYDDDRKQIHNLKFNEIDDIGPAA